MAGVTVFIYIPKTNFKNIDYDLSCTIRTIVYVEPHFCFVRTTYFCCKNHLAYCFFKNRLFVLLGPPFVLWFYKDRLLVVRTTFPFVVFKNQAVLLKQLGVPNLFIYQARGV